MPDNLLSPEYGLSNSKLQECTANPSDVMNGKTFYSGDKTKKTGTMANRGFEQIGGGFAWDNDYVYIQPIPEGYYYNDNPDAAPWNPRVKIEKQKMFDLLGGNYTEGIAEGIACDESYLYLQPIPEGYYHRINQENWWDPRVKIDKQKLWELLGGNHSGWSTTINPGGSVIIPRGYHDGEHRVYASSIQDTVKTASFNLSLYSEGAPYGGIEEKWWSPGGTVIGMTNCNLQADTQSGNSNATDIYCEISNGQVHFVTNFTHRGGWTYAKGTVVYI